MARALRRTVLCDVVGPGRASTERGGSGCSARTPESERSHRSRIRFGRCAGATLENGAARAQRVSGMTKNGDHLAQFNIARIRYRLDDPRMREFVDNVARVNGL